MIERVAGVLWLIAGLVVFLIVALLFAEWRGFDEALVIIGAGATTLIGLFAGLTRSGDETPPAE